MRACILALAVFAMTLSGLWLVAADRELRAAGAPAAEAIALLRDARIAQPDPGPDLARAQQLARAGRPQEARTLLRRVTRAEPRNRFARELLADLLADR